ncbi:MAG: DUF2505 domain-containing protein [Nocardiaceae bacterium]|nr:DUF2505 domain-containing protein [Nocardiaceae bacterium]
MSSPVKSLLMARRLDYSAQFVSHTVPQVWAALQNTDHWEARLDELRVFSPNELTSLEVEKSKIDATFNHIIPRELMPELARAVLRKDMVITRREHFAYDGKTITGHSSASIPGGPGSLNARTSVAADGRGAVLRVTFEAQVNIPIVGGQLERVMLTHLLELLDKEWGATGTWLDANSRAVV